MNNSKLVSTLLSEVDYLDALTPSDKTWLYHFLTGTTFGSERQLSKILTEDQALMLSADCTDDRNAYRRDIMNKWEKKKEVKKSSENGGENYHTLFQEGQYMNTFEDALIEAIDAERRGVANSFRSYGNDAHIPLGSEVVVCIEGHVLQNKLGKVIEQRRNEFLVQVQTNKGVVSLYLRSHELARVNQMRGAV